MPQQDFVDDLIASWSRGRPDLDVTPMAVATRLARVRDHLEGEMASVFGAHGVSSSSFVVLATLVRLGEGTTVARLAAELGLTEGTIALRADRLVAEGIVALDGDVVVFTDRGRTLADEVVRAHLANLAGALGALDAAEQEQLAGLLRRLLVALEG